MALTPRLSAHLYGMTVLLACIALLISTPATAATKEAPKDASEAEYKIYELEFESDSNWTSVEIRDDAVFVNAPVGSSMNITSKDGLRSFTVSPQKIHIRSRSRGLVNMNLFVRSKNNVLGLTLCKGSRSSYAWIKSDQSSQKNDRKEQDHCETAALVLNLF